MTPNSRAKQLFNSYAGYALLHLRPSTCKHAVIREELESLTLRSRGLLAMEELGASLEGRSINMVRAGKGTKRVLLWSQMHGDETTATLALMDMFNFLVETGRERSWVSAMLEDLSIIAIPMLNPDGAEIVQRQNASHIDLNRDARTVVTPEARILRETHRAFKPLFGFNLHDQELRSVGASKKVAVLAFLAPAADAKRNRPISRMRAMRVCALMARALNQFVDGHIATYDDSYEGRAFGDRMQSWGTSTILIESGHWPKDTEKGFVRKLNFVSLLVALHAIAAGSYQDVELEHYYNLTPNGTFLYDIIVRNVKLLHSSGWSSRVDLGITLEPQSNRRSPVPIATIKEIGDLSTHAGLQTLDASARRIPAGELSIDRRVPLADLLDLLQLYHART
jgi:hypothetical protein